MACLNLNVTTPKRIISSNQTGLLQILLYIRLPFLLGLPYLNAAINPPNQGINLEQIILVYKDSTSNKVDQEHMEEKLVQNYTR